MGKARDKAGKRGAAGGQQADKAKERSERTRLRKERERNSVFSSSANDREFEAQVEQIGCKIKFIEGDGNCLFRSLADQLEGRPQDHYTIRAKVMDHIERNRDAFEPYMEDDESFDNYMGRMRGDAEWGGHQELVAASQLYKANVIVHQFKAPRFFIPFEKARLTVHLSYHGEHHYNSVRAISDEGAGPARPITLQTPTSRNSPRIEGSPWPAEEAAVSRSCPWAKQPDVLAALESTGGRGEDAIELLIAARNEPGLEGEVSGAGDGAREKAGAGESDPGNGGRRALDSSPSGGNGAADNGRGDDGEAGLAKEDGKKQPKKSGKATRKVTRAADCPCGSGLKYKKCCRKKDAVIARGQVAPPAEPKSTTGDSSIVDDLGSLVI
eukprot:g13083.t1